MNQNLQFHVFETKETKTTTRLEELQALLHQIKNGDEYTPYIEAIRKAGKGSKQYEAIKSGRECVVWNATFSDGKTEKAISDMTGLIYMDIDNLSVEEIPSIKQQLIAYPYVKATWMSIGGKGVGCLVYCDQVNKDNFKAIWNLIATTLSFNFDGATNSLNRLNFISYGPEILINETVTSFAFSAAESYISSTSAHIKVNCVPNENSNEQASSRGIQLTKFKVYDGMVPYEYNRTLNYQTTLSEDVFNGQRYKVFKDKTAIHKINMFVPTPRGTRNNNLFAKTANLLILNPQADKQDLLHEVYKMNNRFEVPMESKEVLDIFSKCYKRLLAGELYAKAAMKTMVFNPRVSSTRASRRVDMNREFGKLKRERTDIIIKEALQKFTFEGTLCTQKEIIAITGLSRSTVQRYYKRQKCESIIKEQDKS